MSVTFPGVMMDIGHLRHLRVAKDNDTQTWINYNRQRGQQQSFLEAAVPEQFFTDPVSTVKPEGVSAAKIIAIAAAQGQKIFTLTQANAATMLPQIQQSASVMSEIQNALNAGKEVTVSEKPVTVAGWTGAGYIIIAPITGAGAYLIEGGANGGNLSGVADASGALMIISLLAGQLITAGIIKEFTIAAPYYAMAFAAIVFSIAIIEIATTGIDKNCEGSPTCWQSEVR